MAKICKEKFTRLGVNMVHTTSAGDIELTLCYDARDNIFYFPYEEMVKYFPEMQPADVQFRRCRTRDDAVTIFKAYLEQVTGEKKYLSIEIGVPDKYDKSGLTEQGKKIIERCGIYRGVGMSLEFKRVLKLDIGTESVYVEANKNWKYNKSGITKYYNNNLIEWDEETEAFLIKVQEELKRMTGLVVDFFNTESPDELKQRIKNSPLMLTGKK